MTQQTMEKVCFVIAPIGVDGSPERFHSNGVLKNIIEPATEECGYKAVRADQIATPGIITQEIIKNVSEAPLVIANLTNQNPNVFYELALRHTLEKPVILIAPKGLTIPFDIANSRAIFFDLEDKSSVDKCRQEIIKQIRAIEESPENYDNPISIVVNIQRLRADVPFTPEDVRKAFEQISNLAEEIGQFELRSVCKRLREQGIETRGQLMRLMSKEILDTVGTVYSEELERSKDKLLDVEGIIIWGSHFLYNGMTDESIAYVRDGIHNSNEYRRISGGLYIVKALYGASDTWRDVTDIVKARIWNNSITLSVGNDTLGGDPIYGLKKQLKITYFYNRQTYSKEFYEDTTLILP